MINRFFKKYLSIIFVLSSLLGVLHHHNDLQQHNDCKICVLQASIANADTPVDVVYVSQLHLQSEAILTKLTNLHSKKSTTFLFARAPPFFS